VSRAPWVAHFGLDRTPFGKSIAAKDLFTRQAHQEAVAPHQTSCIVESAMGVVTGDVGAGKDGLGESCRLLARPDTSPGHLHRQPAAFGTRGLLCHDRAVLGAEPRYLKAELMAQAADLLAAEASRAAPPGSCSSSTRPISWSRPSSRSSGCSRTPRWTRPRPSPASWFGQPTLNRQLRMGIFAALDQRIATRFSIKAMDLAESAAYLRHHLVLAGREEPLFADDAVARLHRVSNGLPRALNNAATAALIAAAAENKDLVDDACARRPPPSSPGTDRAHGRGERTTMVIKASRAVLTERCRLMCRQRGR